MKQTWLFRAFDFPNHLHQFDLHLHATNNFADICAYDCNDVEVDADDYISDYAYECRHDHDDYDCCNWLDLGLDFGHYVLHR
jgi:hypothetical protein